ncbi:TRAP transporter small permease [Aestuariivita sp.]|jgi:TRAP-type C4-dicarboxylate transport system permease small subunit|uniref:TRAP transporter small permease n=1 Tax=Aestuariivita sp. TaxID=1872407 RepID=UPI002171049B|nr:TRAP transporter small permease [Aestuariivita sp.]MCE8008197.1 TRAP transporter small permease [Aestuariivita sp.]
MEPSPTHTATVYIRGLTPASTVLAGIACLVLFAMMLLTFVDVMGRYVFLAPLPAAYEMISLMMPAIIFCALPLSMLRETHVTVDLLDAFVPRGLARVQGVAVNLFSAAALALVTWRLGVKTVEDRNWETITDELLLLVWPFGAGMTVLCAIAAVAALVNAWTYATGAKKRGIS